MEEWRDIQNYENYYQVSDLGRVRSLERIILNKGHLVKRKSKILSLNKLDTGGYPRCGLSINSKRKDYAIHRLVAMTFIDNPNNLPQVNHIDGNKQNNRVENLEWCTSSENIKHAIYTGLSNIQKGENSGPSKLTEKDVQDICNLLTDGNMTQTEIANKFNVWQGTISAIKNKKNWKHSPFVKNLVDNK